MQPNHWEALTLCKAKADQITEFRKKYQGAYIWLKVDELDPILVRYDSDDDSEGLFYLKNKITDVGYAINYKSNVILSACFPQTKLITYDKTLLLFTRIPARQYRRAPTDENCAFMNTIDFSAPRHFPSMLLTAFEDKFVSLDEGIELLKNSHIGVALTNKIGVTLNPETDKSVLLWCYDDLIADIQLDNNEITMKNPYFTQEVSDFLKRGRYFGWSIV